MPTLSFPTKYVLLLFSLVVISGVLPAQGSYYWIGGTGSWEDPNHWSKTSGGTPVNDIPSDEIGAIIDNNSGLSGGATLTIPGGNFNALSLIVTNTQVFTLAFAGTSGDPTTLTLWGDLILSPSMQVTYASPGGFNNKWQFDGGGSRDIITANHDLLSVVFLHASGTYVQGDNLEASASIRMHAGTWNTNGYTVSSSYIRFQDSGSSETSLPKMLVTGGSEIYADEWDAKFTYGSLTVSGSHTIYSKIFVGSPQQLNGPPFAYDEIHLLEMQDGTFSGASLIESNNFECRGCLINTIIIKDTGETKLADRFTVVDELIVKNTGSILLFNGGNNRTSEVTIEGTVFTPAISGCADRTIFAAVHTNVSTFIKTSGTLTVKDAVMDGIQATGGATFQLANGLLLGASSGWELISAPSSLPFSWVGKADGSIGDWNDPDNWVGDDGRSNGCLPGLTDDVFVAESARGPLRIPPSYTAQCRNFTWTNKSGLELRLDGTNTLLSALEVSGDLLLHRSMVFTGLNQHILTFSSATTNRINTDGVRLTKLNFVGEFGSWLLEFPLTCTDLFFSSGTLDTGGNDIVADSWLSTTTEAKVYYFRNSDITVNGEFTLSPYTYSNVTVFPGSSQIICEKLTSTVEQLYEVKLINSSPLTLSNYPYNFNTLILAGSGRVNTQNSLILNDLIFAADGSALALKVGEEFIVNGSVISQTSSGNAGSLSSQTSGTQASIDKTSGNLCVSGPVLFQDIDAVLTGVLHAPAGIDQGNNTGIDFTDAATSPNLFWIGGSGNWALPGNWAQVSGGCPATKNPADSPHLVFDDNGLFSDDETITVPVGSTANRLEFNNTVPAIIDIISTLEVVDLVVADGYITVDGKNMTVENTTLVSGNAVLLLRLLDLLTPKMEATNGLVILRPGTNVTIQP